jgi:hypothetical protein
MGLSQLLLIMMIMIYSFPYKNIHIPEQRMVSKIIKIAVGWGCDAVKSGNNISEVSCVTVFRVILKM